MNTDRKTLKTRSLNFLFLSYPCSSVAIILLFSASNPITTIAAHNATNQFPYRVYGVRSEMYVNPV